MRLRRIWLLALLGTLGCLTEYHPEVHSESRVTYVQNISSPVTAVYGSVAPSTSTASTSPKTAGPARSGAAATGLYDAPGAAEARPVLSPYETTTGALAHASYVWRDLFEEERAALRERAKTRPPGDGWERVVGRPRPGEGEVDVEAEVPLWLARALARDPMRVEASCMVRGRSTGHGRLAALREHPGGDGLAQILIKARDLGVAEAGEEVAVSVGLGGRRSLTVGHVAGAAAETADEATVRQGICRRGSDRHSLSCSGSLAVSRAGRGSS
jgi:hypothetical protein